MPNDKNEFEHELIKNELNVIKVQFEQRFDSISETLNKILEQTKLTNGRVTNLEKINTKNVENIDELLLCTEDLENTTEVWRLVSKHKWLLILLAIGAYTAFSNLDFIELAKKVF